MDRIQKNLSDLADEKQREYEQLKKNVGEIKDGGTKLYNTINRNLKAHIDSDDIKKRKYEKELSIDEANNLNKIIKH